VANPAVLLEVLFGQKDAVKALGARWDPTAQCWYVPPGRDLEPFRPWLPPVTSTGGRQVRVRLIGQGQRCYRCDTIGVALAGILVPSRFSIDPSGFVSFDFVGRALGVLVNDTRLAERYQIGRIRLRSSQQRPEGYVANACRTCDALFGSFPLQEALTEYLAGGGSLSRLVIAEIDFPVMELPYVDSAWVDYDEDAEAPHERPVSGAAAPSTIAVPAPPTQAAAAVSSPAALPAEPARRRRRRRGRGH
jgi:hypothetical protein